MFTFDDLANLLPGSVSTLVRFADKREMALALKAADEPMRQMFFGAMTQRAAKMMQDDMRAMGPVRVSECEEAQMSLVRLTKSLAERNEIVMPGPKDDEAMIV
jgi:flagellar motor switch protein FliG